MELTLPEVEALTGLSRCQLSRYAADGRLERTRQGHYDAASMAGIYGRYAERERLVLQAGFYREERLDRWLSRQRVAFRRRLRVMVRRRHPETPLTPAEVNRIEAAATNYAACLAIPKAPDVRSLHTSACTPAQAGAYCSMQSKGGTP